MKRDLPISSAVPVEVANRIFDSADRELNVESFHGAARDEVISELCEGKIVGTFKLADVLDCAFDARYSIEIPRLSDLLLADQDERKQYTQRLVEEFVDSHVRLIQVRAEFLAESADDAAYEASRERE